MYRTARSWPVAALLILGANACSGESGNDEPSGSAPSGSTTQLAQVAAEDYAPSRFGDSAEVDHRWYPLQPGTRLDYRGSSLTKASGSSTGWRSSSRT